MLSLQSYLMGLPALRDLHSFCRELLHVVVAVQVDAHRHVSLEALVDVVRSPVLDELHELSGRGSAPDAALAERDSTGGLVLCLLVKHLRLLLVPLFPSW